MGKFMRCVCGASNFVSTNDIMNGTFVCFDCHQICIVGNDNSVEYNEVDSNENP